MFVWICPQCGREVPPHDTECPFCALTAAESREQAPAAPPAPETPAAKAAPAAPPVYVIGPARRTPGWLVALLVAVGLTALGGGAYYWLLASKRSANQAAAPERTPEATAATTSGNRLSKYIEATGFRVTEDERKRLNVRFLIVNHSPADIGDLAGRVYLKTTEGKSIADFDFKTTRLGPYESIEFTVVVSTTLRAYEIPDWQFLRADLEITSPSSL